MTPEETRAGIAALEPWWQCIDLGNGITTKSTSMQGEPVDHPRERWERIQRALPADLTGKSVLDVGCNAGFFAIEAKRRNAARVFGVDASRREIRQAIFARDVLGMDIEYRRLAVYDLTPSTVGQFEVTLALGLVYHLRHLVLALERLFAVTRELLVVESSVLPTDKWTKPFNYVSGEWVGQLHPLGYVENAPDVHEHAANWFFPSVSALQILLRDVGFSRVETIDVRGQSVLLACHKDSGALDSRGARGLAADLSLVDAPQQAAPGSPIQIRVRAENVGSARWLARGKVGGERGAVRLGAHLFREGNEISWDYSRADLARDIHPGESTEFAMTIEAPQQPGRYEVELDLVAEHVVWFEDAGPSGTGIIRHQIHVD